MLLRDASKILDFEEFLREKKRLAESSIYIYKKCLEQFLVTNPTLNSIDDYNNFLIKHSIKSRSRHYYSILKTFIEFHIDDASERNRLVSELIRSSEQPRMKKERKYLEEKELLNLINNLKHYKHKVMALIQDATGIRVGDVLRIRRGDIIPETYKGENTLRIIITGKGNKRNVIYLHDEVVQQLVMEYIVKNFTDQEYYFINRTKKNSKVKVSFHSVYRQNYNQYLFDLKQSMDLCGLEHDSFATHDYRRCYARRVWTKYKDLYVLQELLNHSDPKTTMRYLKGSGLRNIDYHKEMQS